MLRYTEYINLKIYITDALAVCVNFRQSLQHFTKNRHCGRPVPELGDQRPRRARQRWRRAAAFVTAWVLAHHLQRIWGYLRKHNREIASLPITTANLVVPISRDCLKIPLFCMWKHISNHSLPRPRRVLQVIQVTTEGSGPRQPSRRPQGLLQPAGEAGTARLEEWHGPTTWRNRGLEPCPWALRGIEWNRWGPGWFKVLPQFEMAKLVTSTIYIYIVYI
jgi:hypothetical protein